MIVLGGPVLCRAASIDFSGYFKSFFTLLANKGTFSNGKLTGSPDYGIVTNNIRIKSLMKISNSVDINIAYDIYPSISSNTEGKTFLPVTSIEPAAYRLKDFKTVLYPTGDLGEGNFTLNHNLDRFFLTIKSNFADIFIGRQSIAWGSARVFNTTDILTPFNFNQLDKEERSGVDAVRIRIPVGTMNELDAGFVFGKNFRFDESAFYLRCKFNILKFDISLIAAGFRENVLAGLDISSSIFGAGVWAEMALVRTSFFKQETSDEQFDYLRISAGADYNLRGNYYVYAEYLYNSAGKSRAVDYINMFTEIPFAEGNVFQTSKNYLSLGVNKQIHPLIGANNLVIWNIDDGSLIISPVIDYNIKENIYISAGAFIGIGKRPELNLNGSESEGKLTLRSEFGSYPSIIYSSFRIYF